ncbi:MAG TPA: CoA-binding protein [Bauldia sp.]|nr:CoA-binding protein [Bauldia sp.]
MHSNPPDPALASLFGKIRTIAIVGASPNPARPVFGVMRYLLGAGYRVIPVNPGQTGREILGQRVYGRLADVAEPIDVVDIFRRREALGGITDEVLALSPLPKAIWMQLDLVDEAAAAKAEAAGLTVVMDRCIKIDHARLM